MALVLRSFLYGMIFFSCSRLVYLKPSYRTYYAYREDQKKILALEKPFVDNNTCFVLFLVDAKHLDYSSCESLLLTIAKHPNGSKRRDIGHAWVLLSWVENNKRYYIEGGQSGEQPNYGPGYLDTIYQAAKSDTSEKEPIRFLFMNRHDGFLQKGNGGHMPTFAAAKYITSEECEKLKALFHPSGYSFTTYNLIHSHCCAFVEKVAQNIQLDLSSKCSLLIPSSMIIRGETIILHKKKNITVTLSTPDSLEKKLVEFAKQGRLLPAQKWYKHKKNFIPVFQ